MQKSIEFGSGSLPPAQIDCLCGEKIMLPIEALLQLRGANCWNCGARLEVDGEASADALEALGRLKSRIESVHDDAVS